MGRRFGLTVARATSSISYVKDDPKRDAFEYALRKWAAQRRESDETRDELVLGAIAAGISKHRIHVLTGIARTTINRIHQQGGAVSTKQEEIVRAKGVIDGAATLAEAAQKARDFADEMDRMAAEGYDLCDPVEDDYGFITKP